MIYLGMSTRKRLSLILGFALLGLPASNRFALGADDLSGYAGVFENERVVVEFTPAGERQVTGFVRLGSQKFPATGHLEEGKLVGEFESDGAKFGFTAMMADGQLRFQSGRNDFRLTRKGNPLDGGPNSGRPNPATPGGAAAGAAADTPTLGAFSVLGSTETGKTLFLKLPAGLTLETALYQTADELGKVFDAKPELSNGFGEAKTQARGGASLTARLKGKDVRGVILCGINPKGGSATVVFSAVDAPKEEVAKLFSAMPAAMKLKTYQFPDGSGSVDLPEGWKTPDPTATYGFTVQGPKGQRVAWNVMMAVHDPNCQLVRQARQNYDMMARNWQMQANQRAQMLRQFPNMRLPELPKQPTPPDPDPNVQFPPVTFCKFCETPEEIVKTLGPIIADNNKRAGKRYVTLDKILATVPDDPDAAKSGNKAGVIYLLTVAHDGNVETHMRQANHYTSTNVIAGEGWQAALTMMAAPDDTFDAELPTMNAILESVKIDMEVANKRFAADGEQVRQWGQAQFESLQRQNRQFQDAQAQRFADHQRMIAAQQKARHDSNSDFIEYIGGVRNVYNNQTGQMGTVNLFHANGIVAGLNSASGNPNQYVQVPLRYLR